MQWLHYSTIVTICYGRCRYFVAGARSCEGTTTKPMTRLTSAATRNLKFSHLQQKIEIFPKRNTIFLEDTSFKEGLDVCWKSSRQNIYPWKPKNLRLFSLTWALTFLELCGILVIRIMWKDGICYKKYSEKTFPNAACHLAYCLQCSQPTTLPPSCHSLQLYILAPFAIKEIVTNNNSSNPNFLFLDENLLSPTRSGQKISDLNFSWVKQKMLETWFGVRI